jgi:predicted nucleotidyltransferase
MKNAGMTEAIIEESTLAALVAALVEALRPEKIVLFGSAARGDAGPDSDIDLFVQVATGVDTGEATRKCYAAIRPLRPEIPRGVDFIVHDRAFVERYGDLVGTIVRAVRRDGKVLYERG